MTLWSQSGRMLDRQVRANQPRSEGGLARLDVWGIEAWLVDALGAYRDEPVETIIPVGHGAGVVALADGALAFPPLDYEQTLPPETLRAYRAERDPFSLTGSPALPDGLNIGAQLFWLDRLHPEAMARATLLPWAQYWAWFLSGAAASEVTSLACHSDLWSPGESRFSPMAMRLGWAERFAPLARAGDVVGHLRPEIARATGLSARVEVLAGIHDSNAALLAARGFAGIAGKEATILSTGTWFVAMRLPDGIDTVSLAEHRDCLVNVDADGERVPSARFMGGREIEIAVEDESNRIDIGDDQPRLVEASRDVAVSDAMLLPTLAPGCGPFPDGEGRWIDAPADRNRRRAAVALYAALVTDAALDLIGARERLAIEGRFAKSEIFVRALSALRPQSQVYTASADNDASFGALRLIDPGKAPAGELRPVHPLPLDLDAYRALWRERIAARA